MEKAARGSIAITSYQLALISELIFAVTLFLKLNKCWFMKLMVRVRGWLPENLKSTHCCYKSGGSQQKIAWNFG